MIRNILVFVLLLAALSACSRHAAQPTPIVYPATPAGDALRAFYTKAEEKVGEEGGTFGDFRVLMRSEETMTAEDKDALKSTMLAIIGQDDSPRALMIAYMLTEWDPAIAATAPEFRHLLPALVKGLESPNDERSTEWSAIASAQVLAGMGPVAVRPVRNAIVKRFLAPAPPNENPIQGESGECWTRYILGHLLGLIDETSIAALAKGLDHEDRVVRSCAFEGIVAVANPKIMKSLEEEDKDRVGWRLSPEHKAVLLRAAGKQAAKIAEHLWDDGDDDSFRMAARNLRYLLMAGALTAKDFTPRIQQRLFEFRKKHSHHYDAEAILKALDLIPANMDISLHGPIVDQDGNPLDGVLMSQTLSRFWTITDNQPVARKTEPRIVGRNYRINERGEDLYLTFTKDGYHPVQYSVSTRTGPVVRFSSGGLRFNALTIGWDEWALDGETMLPIVMYAKGVPNSDMKIRSGTFHYNYHDPKKALEDHGRYDDWQLLLAPHERLKHDRDHGDELPAGIVYLTFEKGKEKGKDLPKKISIHINSDDGGLVRIEPRFGYAPLRIAAEAPDAGYTPTLTIDNARLEEMWSAREDDLIGAHEYFYFRHNGHYGKGMIAWFLTRDSERSSPSFRYKIFMARNPGDRQLISRTLTER